MVLQGGKIEKMDRVKKISVSIPESVVDQVADLAEKDSRSLSSMLTVLVKEALKNKAA